MSEAKNYLILVSDSDEILKKFRMKFSNIKFKSDLSARTEKLS
jgi:hypothetical protein